MKKRVGLLLIFSIAVIFAILVIFSAGFVSAYEVGGEQGYCTIANNDVGYVYKTTIKVVGYKDFNAIQTEGMYCKSLPSGITLDASQISTVFLSRLNSYAFCPNNYIVYGFMCDSENDGTPSDCQYDNKIRLYCVRLAGNYNLTYWDTAFHKNFLDCSANSGFISGIYSYSDATQLKLRCVKPVCTSSTEVCDGLDNDCDGQIDEGDVCPGIFFDDPLISRGLTSMWTMDSSDGSSNSVAVDIAGGKNGTVIGAVHSQNQGIDEDSYYFNSDDIINVSSLFSLGRTQSWWVAVDGIWSNYINNNGTTYKNGQLGAIDSGENIFSLNGNVVFGENFSGYLDEVVIWNRTLTEEEIEDIFEYYFEDDEIPVCGNSQTELTEECDDGNLVNNDGCSSLCATEPGWSCTDDPNGCCEIDAVCSSGQIERNCLDISTRLQRACFLNEETGCNEWPENYDEIQCSANLLCSAGQCIGEGGQPIRFCGDYLSEEECSTDELHVCDATVNGYLFDKVAYTLIPEEILKEGFCDTDNPLNPDPEVINPYGKCNFYAEDCECGWISGDCNHKYSQSRICDDPSGNLKGECTFSTTSIEDNCETTGYIAYTSKATWTGEFEALEGTCNDYVKQYKCVETAKLPFFEWISFIATSALILLFYCFSRKRK